MRNGIVEDQVLRAWSVFGEGGAAGSVRRVRSAAFIREYIGERRLAWGLKERSDGRI